METILPKHYGYYFVKLHPGGEWKIAEFFRERTLYSVYNSFRILGQSSTVTPVQVSERIPIPDENELKEIQPREGYDESDGKFHRLTNSSGEFIY